MDEIIFPLLKAGQSLHHIMVSNPVQLKSMYFSDIQEQGFIPADLRQTTGLSPKIK